MKLKITLDDEGAELDNLTPEGLDSLVEWVKAHMRVDGKPLENPSHADAVVLLLVTTFQNISREAVEKYPQGQLAVEAERLKTLREQALVGAIGEATVVRAPAPALVQMDAPADN